MKEITVYVCVHCKTQIIDEEHVCPSWAHLVPAGEFKWMLPDEDAGIRVRFVDTHVRPYKRC